MRPQQSRKQSFLSSMSTNQHNVDSETKILSKIGKHLYLNNEKADVHFLFESEDERVPAHKILLSSGSDVFQTMFYGPLKEEGDIKIVDATAEAFKEFLRFFYFNKVDVSMEHVSGVMYLGRKYNVAECQRLCVNLLAANVTYRTVTSTLSLAIFYEEKQLKQSCESIITSRTDEVFKSDNFLDCDRRVLEHIVKMDRLACTEQVLFEACMSWVRATSNEDHLTRNIVQTHLGRLFYEIRFGTMTSEEFGELLPVYGELFSPNERTEILRVISGKERKPRIFKARPRLQSWDIERLILCSRLVGDTLRYYNRIQSEEITKFSTNRRLPLGLISIGPIFNDDSTPIEYIPNMNVTIIASSTEIVTQFDFSFSDNRFSINLPKPVCIRPGTIYEIRIKFPTDEQRFTCLSVKPTVNMGSNVVLHFYDDKKVSGRFVGLIRWLGFNLVDL